MARGKPARKHTDRHPLRYGRSLSDALACNPWPPKASASNTQTICSPMVWTSRPISPPKPCSSWPAYVSKPPPKNSPRALRDGGKGADYRWFPRLSGVAWLTSLCQRRRALNPVFVSPCTSRKDAPSVYRPMPSERWNRHNAARTAGITVEYTPVPAKLAQIGGALYRTEQNRKSARLCACPKACIIEESTRHAVPSCKSEADIARIREAYGTTARRCAVSSPGTEDIIGSGGSLTEIDGHHALSPPSVRPGFISWVSWHHRGLQRQRRCRDTAQRPKATTPSAASGLCSSTPARNTKAARPTSPRVVLSAHPRRTKRDNTSLKPISRAKPCSKTSSPLIDAIAANPCSRRNAIRPRHGHGVGYFLRVTGPAARSRYAPRHARNRHEKGISYLHRTRTLPPGKMGHRIEKPCANWPSPPLRNRIRQLPLFWNLTLCPIATRGGHRLAMTAEIDWVNRYHAEVRRRLEPLTRARQSVADQTHRTAGALNSTAQKCRLKSHLGGIGCSEASACFHLAASKYGGLTKVGQGDEAAEVQIVRNRFAVLTPWRIVLFGKGERRRMVC